MVKAARLVTCLDNSGYEVSLERRKIYVAIPDAKAQKLGQLRVVDESGALCFKRHNKLFEAT
jgi:hypothetical protein